MQGALTRFINAMPAWFLLLLSGHNLVKLGLAIWIMAVDGPGLARALAARGLSPQVTGPVTIAWAAISALFFAFAVHQRHVHGGWRGPGGAP